MAQAADKPDGEFLLLLMRKKEPRQHPEELLLIHSYSVSIREHQQRQPVTTHIWQEAQILHLKSVRLLLLNTT